MPRLPAIVRRLLRLDGAPVAGRAALDRGTPVLPTLEQSRRFAARANDRPPTLEERQRLIRFHDYVLNHVDHRPKK